MSFQARTGHLRMHRGSPASSSQVGAKSRTLTKSCTTRPGLIPLPSAWPAADEIRLRRSALLRTGKACQWSERDNDQGLSSSPDASRGARAFPICVIALLDLVRIVEQVASDQIECREGNRHGHMSSLLPLRRPDPDFIITMRLREAHPKTKRFPFRTFFEERLEVVET